MFYPIIEPTWPIITWAARRFPDSSQHMGKPSKPAYRGGTASGRRLAHLCCNGLHIVASDFRIQYYVLIETMPGSILNTLANPCFESCSMREFLVSFFLLCAFACQTAVAQDPRSLATVKTTQGDFTIELFESQAPNITRGFRRLVNEGFYDGLIFHRVLAGFILQAGAYLPDRTEKVTPTPIQLEPPKLKNLKYTVAFVAHGNNRSQFFINMAYNERLQDPVFGKVVQGIDVVEKISRMPANFKNERGAPEDPVRIISIRLNTAQGSQQGPLANTPPQVRPAPDGTALTAAGDSLWYCPKIDATFADESGRPVSKDLVSAVFEATRTSGSRVWTGEAWVERDQTLLLRPALKHYSQAIESGAADGEVYRRRAAVYRHRGELSFAILDYNRAIALSPQSGLAYAGRGIVYRTQGSLERALKDLDRAVELLPSHAAVRIARANVYSSLGDHSKAAEAFRDALALDEKSALAHKNLAAELYLLKDFTNALVHYEKAYALTQDVALLHDIALVHLARKEPQLAEYDLYRILAERPQDARLLSTLAMVYAINGKIREAEQHFDEAVTLEPADPMHWHNRGILRLGQQQYAGALRDFQEALKLDPAYVPSLLVCARLLSCFPDEKAIDADAAIGCGMKALQATRFRSAAAYTAAASAYAALGSFDDAIRCQQKAIELLPEGTSDEKTRLEKELGLFRAKKRITSLPTFTFEY